MQITCLVKDPMSKMGNKIVDGKIEGETKTIEVPVGKQIARVSQKYGIRAEWGDYGFSVEGPGAKSVQYYPIEVLSYLASEDPEDPADAGKTIDYLLVADQPFTVIQALAPDPNCDEYDGYPGRTQFKTESSEVSK